jgi:hypothetical protein
LLGRKLRRLPVCRGERLALADNSDLS